VLGSRWVDGQIGEVADKRMGMSESMQTSMSSRTNCKRQAKPPGEEERSTSNVEPRSLALFIQGNELAASGRLGRRTYSLEMILECGPVICPEFENGDTPAF
jgi:hypothetical protein